MKKTLAIMLLVIVFFIIYFLQANFFSWFTIAGVKPNLFVILVLNIAIFAGRKVAIPLGIFLGIFLDFVIAKNIGISSLMYAVIAYLGGFFEKNFSKDSRITIMLMVAGSTAIYEIGSYILNIISLSIHVEPLNFLKILIIEIIYNSILTIILYPLFQKCGYKLEDIFKGNKILTKYF